MGPFRLLMILLTGKAEIGPGGQGVMIVDSWCRMHGATNVYAIGDCTFSRGPLPATAQVASQQGSYLGRTFSKAMI